MPDFHKFFFVKGILIAAMFAALSFLAVIIISFTPVSGVPVLNYHQINDVDHNAMTITTKQFEAQMKYLSDNNYTAISPDQLIDHLETGAPLPPHPVLITFDDGYKDNYLNAFPILKKYQMTATIFLISDYVSTYEKYLTWDEIALMQRDGIDFESHTSSRDQKPLWSGISASKSIISLIRAAHTILKSCPRQKLPVTAVHLP